MIKLLGDKGLVTKTIDLPEGIDRTKLETRLLESMEGYGGIGLSANQIGLSHRVFVMLLGNGSTLTAINPVYIEESNETHLFKHDGCLSIPGIFAATERRDWVTLSYEDAKGAKHQSTFHALEAVIVQHEMDHLNGILYIDRVGKLKREMLLKKYHKLSNK